MLGISINREVTSLFITHLIHTQVWNIVEEEKDTQARGKSLLLLGDHLTFGVDYISEEVVEFSPFMVSPRKNTMFIVSCVLLLYLLVSQLKILT